MINAKPAVRDTPLFWASALASAKTVELLIANGPDVNAKDTDFNGGTPLDYAVSRKYFETADFLRKHGVKTGEELKTEGK